MYPTQAKDDKGRIPQPQKFDSRPRDAQPDRLRVDASISPEKPLSEKASEIEAFCNLEWVFLTGSLQGRRVEELENVTSSNTMYIICLLSKKWRDE